MLRARPLGALGAILPLLLVLAVFAAFFPALSNGFVTWDDLEVLVKNTHYRGFAWPQLRWMFTNIVPGPYQPLSWLSFSLDFKLWGLNPQAYHRSSLVLHSVNAVVFYFLSIQLLALAAAKTVSPARLHLSAALAALLFAVHPLRVESVVWATERRDVLSGLFYLLTLLSYVRAHAGGPGARSVRDPKLPLVLFALSLLAKGITITLPATLLILDVYPLRRLSRDALRRKSQQREVLLEKVPYLILSLVFLVVGYFGQSRSAAIVRGVPLGDRFIQPLNGLGFYFLKTIFPAHLSPLYERAAHLDPFAARYRAACATALIASGAAIWVRGRRPAAAAVWAHYAITLAPVLGFIAFGQQLAADRYSYLACLGFPLFATGLLLRPMRVSRFAAFMACGLAGAAILGVAARRQSLVWADSEALWRQALRVDPQSAQAHNYLGMAFLNEVKNDAAISEYRRALQIAPDYIAAHKNLGQALLATGAGEKASREYAAALRLDPEQGDAEYNLGLCFEGLRRWDDAIEHYQKAIVIDPSATAPRDNLGTVFLALDRLEDADREFLAALALDPNDVPARIDSAVVSSRQGRYEDSIAQFKRVLEIEPTNAMAAANLEKLTSAARVQRRR